MTDNDSGWKTKATDEGDGFSLSKHGQWKAGYRFAGDDGSYHSPIGVITKQSGNLRLWRLC